MVENSYVRNVSARLVFERLKKAGVDVEPLLSLAGLQQSDIYKEDGWISFHNHARFFEAAAQALDDPFFALKLSQDIDPREFGALAYVGITSKTLGEALFNLKRYIRVVTGAWNMDVLRRDRFVILEITPDHLDYFDCQPATEWFVANLIRCYQFSIDRNLPPHEVRFVAPLAQSNNLAGYQEYFGCKVSFGQENCQIILEHDAMQLPIKSADDRLLKVLKLHCDQLMQEHYCVDSVFTKRIRENIIDLLPSGRGKVKFIAAKLGLTERTLLRRLADEGTSFSEIREDLRCDLATKYIQDKRLSLKQIAYLLGYSDQSAFSVAFRRWKGCTPRQARNAG